MSHVTSPARAHKAILVLFFPLVVSLIPAIVLNDIIRFRLAGLPVGYVLMIGFTFYLALTTASDRISLKKYIVMIFLVCMGVILPLSVTVDFNQHLVSSILVVSNIYFLWIGLSLGSKADRSALPNVFSSLWPLILICLLSYLLVERLVGTASFPNIFSFFFYRGAEGAFLLALLAIVMFDITQGRRSQALTITFVLILISIVMLESRTTYVATAALLFFSLITSVRGAVKFFMATILVAGIIYFVPAYAERISRLSEISRLLTLDLDAAVKDGASLYRIIYWSGTLEIIRENWITGIGFSIADIQTRFPSDLLKLKSSISRPHNTFLSIFMGFGFFGASFYFTLFFGPAVTLLRRFHLTKKSRQPGRNVVLGYILGVGMLMAGLDLETNPQFHIIFGFTLGYIGLNRQYQSHTGRFIAQNKSQNIKTEPSPSLAQPSSF